MAGTTPSDQDSLEPFLEWKNEVDRQLRVLQRPTGTQTAGLFAQVQAAIANIGAAVTAYLSGGFTTGSMTASGNVTAGGNVTATGTVTGATGMNSVGVYGTILTYGGLYKVQYVHQDGTMGYVPSSIRFKQDVETYWIDIEVLRQLRVVSFRYIAAVENLGDEALTEVGLIAEEVHALGVAWLVDYDEDGKPFGIKYERLALVTLLWCMYLDARMEMAGLL